MSDFFPKPNTYIEFLFIVVDAVITLSEAIFTRQKNNCILMYILYSHTVSLHTCVKVQTGMITLLCKICIEMLPYVDFFPLV